MGVQEFDVVASAQFIPIRGVTGHIPFYGMFQDGDGNIGFAINGEQVFTINSSGGGSSGVVGPGLTNDLAVYPSDGTGVQGVSLSDYLDELFGTHQGALLVRGATEWELLLAGAANEVLTAHGADTPLTWEAGGGGGSPWILPFHAVSGVTALYAMTSDDFETFVSNTATVAVTVRLPAAPVAGQQARVTDGDGNSGTNNITVTDSTGANTIFVIDVDRETVLLRWTGTTWGIVS